MSGFLRRGPGRAAAFGTTLPGLRALATLSTSGANGRTSERVLWWVRRLTQAVAVLSKDRQFADLGANWFRRRTEGVWCAPWLVSRPRKKPTTQKRERPMALAA